MMREEEPALMGSRYKHGLQEYVGGAPRDDDHLDARGLLRLLHRQGEQLQKEKAKIMSSKVKLFAANRWA